jgi:muconolactone delta-isomerase
MRFIVESHFTAAPTPEILAMVPAEQARGREFDAQGIREHLFLPADLSGSWQVFNVQSREELDRALASLPFHPHVAETVTQLTESNDL